MTSAPSRSQRAFTVLAFLAVAGLTAGAFILSYDDLRLLSLAGLKGTNADRFGRYYPAIYDGLVAITLLAVFVARNSRWWVRWTRWAVLFALVAGAIAASVQNALKGFEPIRGTALQAGVASAPWVAALLAIWLWMSMFRQLREGAAQRRAGRRSRRHRPAHAKTAAEAPEIVPGLAEPEQDGQRTDPLKLPTAEDFPNPYRDLQQPAEPFWEGEPAAWEPADSPWPPDYQHRREEAEEETAEAFEEAEPPAPLPVLPEPVRPPASLPTDVKLVGRPEQPEPDPAEDVLASTTQPDFPLPEPDGDEEDGTAAAGGAEETAEDLEDWATYSPERNPPSGSFRSGPTPPKGD